MTTLSNQDVGPHLLAKCVIELSNNNACKQYLCRNVPATSNNFVRLYKANKTGKESSSTIARGLALVLQLSAEKNVYWRVMKLRGSSSTIIYLWLARFSLSWIFSFSHTAPIFFPQGKICIHVKIRNKTWKFQFKDLLLSSYKRWVLRFKRYIERKRTKRMEMTLFDIVCTFEGKFMARSSIMYY